MAKLTITLDTESNELSCDVDGSQGGNVSEVSLSNWSYGDGDPQYHFSVVTFEKVGEVTKMTRLFASESQEGRDALRLGTASPSKKIPGFVEMPAKSKVEEQIAKLLNRERMV